MAKKVDTKNLFNKIDQLTRQRMAAHDVVSMRDFKSLKDKSQPSRVLVIEDDETMRSALRKILEQDRHQVITAVDGTQLSAALGDEFVDLILLDVGLPWINGYELAELMRQDENLKHIPIVFISGRGKTEDIKKGFAVGANDYITKPFQIDEVRKTVQTLLDLKVEDL